MPAGTVGAEGPAERRRRAGKAKERRDRQGGGGRGGRATTGGVSHETWILEAGDGVIGQEGTGGVGPTDQLSYCVWVADYRVQRGGLLAAARAAPLARGAGERECYLPTVRSPVARSCARAGPLPGATPGHTKSRPPRRRQELWAWP